MDSFMPGAQARFIKLHGTVGAFETRFANDFTRFTLFLARQDGIHLSAEIQMFLKNPWHSNKIKLGHLLMKS